MSAAAWRPAAMHRTTRLAPVAASPATNTLSGNSGCWGLRNPMASNTRSASMTSFLPVGFISGRPPSVFGVHSTSSTSTPVTLLSLPMNLVDDRHLLRSQPSSWLELVRSTCGHCGHGVAGLLPTGGFGMISICVTATAP